MIVIVTKGNLWFGTHIDAGVIGFLNHSSCIFVEIVLPCLLRLLFEQRKTDMKIRNDQYINTMIAASFTRRGINEVMTFLWYLKELRPLSIEGGIEVLKDHVYQRCWMFVPSGVVSASVHQSWECALKSPVKILQKLFKFWCLNKNFQSLTRNLEI